MIFRPCLNLLLVFCVCQVLDWFKSNRLETGLHWRSGDIFLVWVMNYTNGHAHAYFLIEERRIRLTHWNFLLCGWLTGSWLTWSWLLRRHDSSLLSLPYSIAAACRAASLRLFGL
ncbi:hypothetical protein MPNT_350003 [Candidatus Methylacidithermus pantelleriae]|uniref:Uncharacterized protein n=1 Tax=Candidatus Methylacidithermus pantelleriae TaxID=2744239 RepID=A0A8J2BMV4_9BACT|nr:hypothetical protein MPNT_350003 [Candidatus Methylacidithermus pantelleriae]